MTTARRLIALLSVLFLVPLLAVTTQTSSASAAGDAFFQPLPGFRPADGAGSVRPDAFRAFRADLAGIRARLSGAGHHALSVPDPAGTPTDFTVVEDSVLAPSLQAAHPEIRTYRGSTSNGTTVRLDVTPLGFHAMVRRPDGVVWYVEPATRSVGESRVLSFAGTAAGDPGSTFVEQEVRRTARQAVAGARTGTDFSTPGGLVSQRVYRLALVTDPTYAAFVAPGAATHATSDPLVLAAKTTLVNRVNEPYNDDVAFRFDLIAGTDKLNLLTTAEFSGANGPCGASACYPDAVGEYDCFSVLERNTFALGMLVGAEKFDIGHIALGVNGGGVAGLGVVGTADKSIGCTGIPTPTGDVYAIDYVAHEMGHQMGGDHTFNGTKTNCSPGNRNDAPFTTQVEPGSGSSIMAYAGICSSDNVQPHSDPYFSFKSIDQFEANAAAAPVNEKEQQVVSLTGFDGTDAFTLTGPSGTSAAVTNGTTYTAAGIAAAVLTATGQVAVVTGYDDAALPGGTGFTVTFAGTTDVPTLVVNTSSGSFTSAVGTTVNGGPRTNGGTVTVTADHSPVVTAPAGKTIPKQTPFTLTGSATDADGDVLTYLWEQTDAGGATGTGLVDNAKNNGPLFRQFGTAAQVSEANSVLYRSPGENLAGTDPSRTFPDLAQVVAGNTNAKTGTCPAPAAAGTVPVTDPALNCFSEFLPTSAWIGNPATPRVMHFRLTARDEFAADAAADHAGGVAWKEVALTVDATAGPFLVTSRSSAGTPAKSGGLENVTWAVAGTNTASMATNVKISLSTDGGLTYPTVLSASTPNDGSELVRLPAVTTTTARLKVEAVGNYFFDLTDANFSIDPNGTSALAPSVVTAKAKPRKITTGHSFKVTVEVGSQLGGVPEGTVQVYRGTKLLGTGTLKNGKVTLKVSKKKAKKLKVGKNTLAAKYLGSATVAPSQADFVIKVKKKKKRR